jgi:hypothetical protein
MRLQIAMHWGMGKFELLHCCACILNNVHIRLQTLHPPDALICEKANKTQKKMIEGRMQKFKRITRISIVTHLANLSVHEERFHLHAIGRHARGRFALRCMLD